MTPDYTNYYTPNTLLFVLGRLLDGLLKSHTRVSVSNGLLKAQIHLLCVASCIDVNSRLKFYIFNHNKYTC